jgi:Cation efflux family
VIYAALACNAAIALAKFLAALFSGSAAMAAEGVHSTVDMANQGLLLYGIKRSLRPPDQHFPFGYGKEVYFWCFVVAIEVFTVGAGAAFVRGVWRLYHPAHEQHFLINYAVLGIAMLRWNCPPVTRGGTRSIGSRPASSAVIHESGVFSRACAGPISSKTKAPPAPGSPVARILSRRRERHAYWPRAWRPRFGRPRPWYGPRAWRQRSAASCCVELPHGASARRWRPGWRNRDSRA